MATQILGTDNVILFRKSIDICSEARVCSETRNQCSEDALSELREECGSVFRGFFYAMLFNLLLLFTGVAVWELWRVLR